ncbi:hypothetical protein [Streptosporangium lutulentum]|uniref:Carboxypeptidase regulatory-like domain-containing protein n=1 Tax=Streptosporangium lutulentum TaxID=1461250 RepID=A0ABT9QRA3_9ACTN|nr:hypothetical protein [Streptosporangium lutulentum]MDP9849281.1 hypothetical protein [Streptosporangium lutulentum]
MPERWADDELLAELAAALHASDVVPRGFAEVGKAAFAWRNIDDELAELIFDSDLHDDLAAPLTRAEPAPLRALTFVAPELTIELEVTEETLVGQLVPYQSIEVSVRVLSGQDITVTTDEVGCFTIRPIPASLFYLHCRTADGTSVSTSWITL